MVWRPRFLQAVFFYTFILVAMKKLLFLLILLPLGAFAFQDCSTVLSTYNQSIATFDSYSGSSLVGGSYSTSSNHTLSPAYLNAKQVMEYQQSLYISCLTGNTQQANDSAYIQSLKDTINRLQNQVDSLNAQLAVYQSGTTLPLVPVLNSKYSLIG